jgi:hypothetical protein
MYGFPINEGRDDRIAGTASMDFLPFAKALSNDSDWFNKESKKGV